MKPNITITSPTLEDIDTLYKWGENNWQLWSDKKYKWFSKKSLRRWLKNPEDDLLFVARCNNKLVGMCITNVIRDWAFCFGLFVETIYRNRGIGKKLLAKTVEQLKNQGVENLILLVDKKNNQARHFYLRENFYQGYEFYLMTKNL